MLNKNFKSLYIIPIVLSTIFCGCANDDVYLQQKEQIQEEVQGFKNEKEYDEKLIVAEKIENDVENYVVTFELRQSHFTLNLSTHAKDQLNKIKFQVPVSEEYYNSVQIGDTISDEFRMGSFILYGSLGNWKIQIVDKQIK